MVSTAKTATKSYSFIDRIVARESWLVALVLLAIAIASLGASRLELTNSYDSALGEHNPHLLDYRKLESEFSGADNLVIVVAPKSGDVFSSATKSLLYQLTELSWSTPFSQRVDSIANFQHTYTLEDELYVAPLIGDPAHSFETDSPVWDVREIALSEPSLHRNLVAENGNSAAVAITLKLPEQARKAAILSATDYVLAIVEDLQADYPEVRFLFSGRAFQERTQFAASESDGKLQFPLLFALIFLVLYGFVRNLWLVLATTVITGLAVAPAAGIIGWTGVAWTVEGSAALSMIMPIAIADSVHVLSNYLIFLRDRSPDEAMQASVRLNFKPVLITSVTTAAGFFCLNLVDSPPLKLIGNTVGIGVLFAFPLSMLVLPLVVHLPGVPRSNVPLAEANQMRRFANWVLIRRGWLFWIAVAVLTFSGWGLTKTVLDQTSSEYYSDSIQFRKDSDWINANLAGVESLNYVLDSQVERGVSAPEYLLFLNEFIDWLRLRPEVVNATGYSDVIKRLNQNMNGGSPAAYSIPSSAELSAQYALFYEQSLPYGLDLTDQLNFDRSASRVRVSLSALSNREILQFDGIVRDWLDANSTGSIAFSGASPSLMFAHQIEDNVDGLLKGWFTTLLLVSVFLCVALRSVRLGLVSLLPNLLPALVAFGFWGWFVGQVGLLTTIAMGVTLGIVVDDTVHLLVKYRSHRLSSTQSGANLSASDSVRYSFATVGVACTATAVALVLGFAVLTTSSFIPHADMGAMSALTIAAAWFVDFLVLPLVLVMIDSSSGSGESEEANLE